MRIAVSIVETSCLGRERRKEFECWLRKVYFRGNFKELLGLIFFIKGPLKGLIRQFKGL